MKNIKYSKLDPKAPLFKLNMDDYFPEGAPKPWVQPLGTKEHFEKEGDIKELLEDEEMEEEFQGDPNKVFKFLTEGSGDGGENFCHLTILDGKIVAVLA